MPDLAAQIRTRLQRPTPLVDVTETKPPWTTEQIEEFRRRYAETAGDTSLIRILPADGPVVTDEQMRAALLAVVERHSSYDFPPDEDDGPGTYAWTPYCDHCMKPWPCPDLRDIAKELGIETP